MTSAAAFPISSLGLVTCIGRDVVTAAAAQRAGIVRRRPLAEISAYDDVDMEAPVVRQRRCGQKSSSQTRQCGFGGGPAIAITGPCRTGTGGVFLSSCNIMSIARGTFLPSNWTSKEKFTNSALPLIFAETMPISEPASSPVDIMKFESFTQTGLPSQLTFFAPLDVSADLAMLG